MVEDSVPTTRGVRDVGTGFTEDTKAGLLQELRALHRQRCPFATVPTLSDAWGEVPTDARVHRVKPRLVTEVEYRQRTAEGLRHAVFKGLRPDITPREVRPK